MNVHGIVKHLCVIKFKSTIERKFGRCYFHFILNVHIYEREAIRKSSTTSGFFSTTDICQLSEMHVYGFKMYERTQYYDAKSSIGDHKKTKFAHHPSFVHRHTYSICCCCRLGDAKWICFFQLLHNSHIYNPIRQELTSSSAVNNCKWKKANIQLTEKGDFCSLQKFQQYIRIWMYTSHSIDNAR